MASQVSPPLTVYEPPLADEGVAGVTGVEELDPPERLTVDPICRLAQLMPGLAAVNCATVRPLEREMASQVSPLTTAYAAANKRQA